MFGSYTTPQINKIHIIKAYQYYDGDVFNPWENGNIRDTWNSGSN